LNAAGHNPSDLAFMAASNREKSEMNHGRKEADPFSAGANDFPSGILY